MYFSYCLSSFYCRHLYQLVASFSPQGGAFNPGLDKIIVRRILTLLENKRVAMRHSSSSHREWQPERTSTPVRKSFNHWAVSEGVVWAGWLWPCLPKGRGVRNKIAALFFFFFPVYWEIIDIHHYITLRFTPWWFDLRIHILWNDPTTGSANIYLLKE